MYVHSAWDTLQIDKYDVNTQNSEMVKQKTIKLPSDTKFALMPLLDHTENSFPPYDHTKLLNSLVMIPTFLDVVFLYAR